MAIIINNEIFPEELLSRLRKADRIAVLTGAGISAESGVPTFRGASGLWKKFRPEELANFEAFIKNPDLVWEWYRYRKKIISAIRPNPGHATLAEMEKHHKFFSLITQNIDNLHRRAGSKVVYELHGNIERNYCIGCGRKYPNEEIIDSEKAPRCSICGGLVRPDVVWFGEMLPEEEWSESVAAAQSSEIFFSIGTSAVVYPAASLPQIARRSGAFLVEINIEPTELSDMTDMSLIGKSGDILPRLFEAYSNRTLS